MDRPHYLLPPSALGVYRRIPVDNVVSANIFSNITPSDQEQLFPVVLSGDPMANTWRVRWQFGILGDVNRTIREEYRDIDRVLGSSLVPETIAGISLTPDNHLDVDLFLPEPELTVPRNNVSADVLVLPPGQTIEIDTATGDFGSADLALASPGQWFVILIEMAGEPVALIDGRVVGAFSDQHKHTVLECIESAKKDNPAAQVAARGYAIDSVITLDIGYSQGDAEHVMPLALPDPRPQDVVSITDNVDGSYSVNVAWMAATDPDDTVPAADAPRRIPSVGNEEVFPEPKERCPNVPVETAFMDLREESEPPADQAEPDVEDVARPVWEPLSVQPEATPEPEPQPAFQAEVAPNPYPPATAAHTSGTHRESDTQTEEAAPALTQTELVRLRRAERARRLQEGIPRHSDVEPNFHRGFN